MKILKHPGLTQEQRRTGEMFKTILLSLNVQSMRLNSGDFKIDSDEEVMATDFNLCNVKIISFTIYGI